MPTNELMPEWCRNCPNKEYCPIRYSDESWYCAAKDILREPKEDADGNS